ncbi:DUF1214 domain-containing protein [Rhizobium sp. SSA_523]|uniref:DUF1214 domain-containing protein n=1 Tax=Rhizobium sp. SSA_523 TaxID=2952477 RepID=UPI0020907AF8|nr:DUF1214 domain-containing protein [Rhizobium sp. SSA_523]MCO5730949.1 DUF1214 domain-containing protein [Rhizobium sp. SSA_523]WKC24241.1 DUF1214 domain-containing protein [Rhizobium sp. SSA_523]
MFRLPLLVALSLAIAFGAGIWSTLVALDATVGFGAIRLGAWEAFPQAQTEAADPYAKAHRANAGRLLLGSAEGLRFTARVDDSNRQLSGQCRYRLAGETPPTRLWTLYAEIDGRPPLADSAKPLALNSRSVMRQPDGRFEVTIAALAAPGNWIAVERDKPFRLVLTLLDTPTAGSSGLIDLTMPALQRIGCDDA